MDRPVATSETEPASVPRRRSRDWAIGLALSLATIVLCVAVAELTGYLWERDTAQGPLGWTLVASRRLQLEPKGSADHPYYLLQPNRRYEWEGIPVEINSRGLRGDEFEVPKPPDLYRALNIGDSVAFGWEVTQEETYGERLGATLNARDDGTTYEVINAAMPGWTLESARNFLVEEGLSYEPDTIILEVTVVNDIYGQVPSDAGRLPLVTWLRDRTYAWPFLTTQARFLLARQRGPEAIPVLNPPREASAYFPLEVDSPRWDAFWQPIADVHQLCKEQDIRLVVLVFPTAFQVGPEQHPDVPQRVLRARAEAAGIELVDLLPIYADTCRAAPQGACDGYENLLFADVWMHPNALGHQLAADALELDR